MRWLFLAGVLMVFVGAGEGQSNEPGLARRAPRDDYTFRIHPDLPEFSFHVRRDEGHMPEGIEVTRNNELVQLLEIVDDVDTPPPGTDLIAVEDVNFDGYADLKFLHWWGATGNRAYFYWLFDKESGKFVFNAKFTDLFNVVPDPEKKLIRTHVGTGAAGNNFTNQWYRVEASDLILVREEKQQWSDEKNCYLKVIQERSGQEMKVLSSQCVQVN
jgi:hypothetical protein